MPKPKPDLKKNFEDTKALFKYLGATEIGVIRDYDGPPYIGFDIGTDEFVDRVPLGKGVVDIDKSPYELPINFYVKRVYGVVKKGDSEAGVKVFLNRRKVCAIKHDDTSEAMALQEGRVTIRAMLKEAAEKFKFDFELYDDWNIMDQENRDSE